MSLGKNISRLRGEKGLSQGDLAERLGVSRQSISKWETDGATPELDKLMRLSEVFGVTLDELVKGEREDASPEPVPAPAPAPKNGAAIPRVSGVNLMSISILALLGFAVIGGFAFGLLLTLPLFVCGMICLKARRRCGLWCGWALFLMADAYLRLATGINWRLTLMTPYFEPQMNYVRLAIGWGQLIAAVVLIVCTVRSFRKPGITLSRKGKWGLLGGWVLFAALYQPVQRLYALIPVEWEWDTVRILARTLADDMYIFWLTALLVITLRAKPWKGRKQTQPPA